MAAAKKGTTTRRRKERKNIERGAAQLTCAKCGIECQAINEIAASHIYQCGIRLAQCQTARIEVSRSGIVVGDGADDDISPRNELFCLFKHAKLIKIRTLSSR